MWSDKSIIHGEGTFENEFHIMWDGITSFKIQNGGGTPLDTEIQTKRPLSFFHVILVQCSTDHGVYRIMSVEKKPTASLVINSDQLNPLAKDLIMGIGKCTAGCWIAIKLIIGV